MRINLRVVLPLIQVSGAVALTTSNLLRHNSIRNPSWIAPDAQFCDGLNAPATLIRFCIGKLADKWIFGYRPFELVLRTVVYFALVGILWYIVGIELGGKGLSVLTPKTGVRRAADFLAVGLGFAVVFIALLVRRQFGPVTTYSNLVSTPYFVWGAIIIGFYAHDFARACISLRGTGPANSFRPS
jgi:hypothetical protein